MNRADPTKPCRWCGSIGCDHPPLMRLYGIRSMAVDERDAQRDKERERWESLAEEDERRRDRQ